MKERTVPNIVPNTTCRFRRTQPDQTRGTNLAGLWLPYGEANGWKVRVFYLKSFLA